MKPGLIASVVAASLLLASMSHAQFAPIVPSIAVTAIDSLAQTTHATPAGSSISVGVVLGVPPLLYDPIFWVDIYVGVRAPDGRFLSLVGDPKAPSLVPSPAPVPWLVGVDVDGFQQFTAPLSFTARAPQGWHALYGVIVESGTSFHDPVNWISASFFPLLVHPDATSP